MLNNNSLVLEFTSFTDWASARCFKYAVASADRFEGRPSGSIVRIGVDGEPSSSESAPNTSKSLIAIQASYKLSWFSRVVQTSRLLVYTNRDDK